MFLSYCSVYPTPRTFKTSRDCIYYYVLIIYYTDFLELNIYNLNAKGYVNRGSSIPSVRLWLARNTIYKSDQTNGLSDICVA